MADPDFGMNQEELWGLKPEAPPTTPTQLPQQAPQQRPALPDISESQRWGTTAMPGQTRPAPYAFDTGAPPTPGYDPSKAPPSQAQVDDAREWDLNKEQEINAYATNRLSTTDYRPLPDAVTPQQHPDWQNLQIAKERLAQQDPRTIKRLTPQLNKWEADINAQTKAANSKAMAERRVKLQHEDAPYQSVEQRQKTADVVSQAVGKEVDAIGANVNSRDQASARQADYNLAVSPVTTMSRPLPGAEKDKPNSTNRDYTLLRDAATDIAVHNRHLPDANAAVRYVIKLGTPAGGTDEKGNQGQGFNGRYGAGATYYKVIGRDDLDNVLVQFDDGMRLRVPGYTYRQTMLARQQGMQRGRAWEENYKKSQEDDWGQRIKQGIDWGLKTFIPSKGF